MPRYSREREDLALPLKMLSHGLVHTTTAREVLLTAFYNNGCCLRNREDEEQVSGTLTGLVDTEGPPK
ncbi:unnamed protein product [Schistosoma curassoni]|uniref:Uncharacterized protein n=1 Tax=Schistosoma curassoni TaxID=6186 RepID=A0A183JT05_9TREM|nr:unnamed protein product [Schistosoma curassoni]